MSKKPPSEKDPLNAELEAALEGQSLLDIDLGLSRLGSSGGAGGGSNRSKAKGGPQRAPEHGDLVPGVIVGIDAPDAIVELGPRMQGVINLSEFDTPPAVGQRFEFTLHGQKEGLWLLSRRKAKAIAAWNEIYPGAMVEARVVGVNTGGLEMEVGPLSGFMPASQAADHHLEDLSSLVGQKLVCAVVEADASRKRLVLSRRKVVAAERAELREQIVGSIRVGDEVRGKVTRVENFGAFVDIGGLEGLVHVSQISLKRVEDAKLALKPGDDVRAKVVKIEEGGKRIGLLIKACEPDPWNNIAARLPVGQVVNGQVVRAAEFGVFVELEPGVDGLLHASQMLRGGERVRRPADLYKVGDTVSVRVQSIDLAQRRISLSRLDERGALIGSEDAVDSAEIERSIEHGPSQPLSTNLGSLFKAIKPPKKP